VIAYGCGIVTLGQQEIPMTRLVSFAAALSVAALSALPALAQSYGIRFQNNSGAVVYRIYYSPADNPSWENDLLGANVLQPGQHLDVTIQNVSNCYYDLLVEFESGYSFTDVVDLCTIGRYVITDRPWRGAGGPLASGPAPRPGVGLPCSPSPPGTSTRVRLRESLVARLLQEEAPTSSASRSARAPPRRCRSGPSPPSATATPSCAARRATTASPSCPSAHRGRSSVDFAAMGHARHVAARLDCGAVVHNVYLPAGGDVPDRDANPKFAQKLDFLAHLRDHFRAEPPSRAILVGDLNVAPLEDDVWSHKQLLGGRLAHPAGGGGLRGGARGRRLDGRHRHDQPTGKLYSWWSYRAPDWHAADKGRRLDHVWASRDLLGRAHASRIHRAARGWDGPSDHVPVFATFDL
jgi:exodeoxyribonuclease-3